jgi:DNA-directed RNA polymerase specialized sigma24 family protein
MEIRQGAVLTRLHRARNKLNDLFDDAGATETTET